MKLEKKEEKLNMLVEICLSAQTSNKTREPYSINKLLSEMEYMLGCRTFSRFYFISVHNKTKRHAQRV
jgi:hypothetical protein